MLPKVSLQTFWIVLLVLSTLWVASVFGPLLFSVVAPTQDLTAIVRALQGQGTPPSDAGEMVQRVLGQGGPLERAIHVGHFAGASVELRNGASHTTTRVEDSYVAWFRKFPKPIVLVLDRYSEDGVLKRYEISSVDSMSPLARAYGLPLAAMAVSIYLVRKRRSPLLKDPVS
jgi:hypothetical protein